MTFAQLLPKLLSLLTAIQNSPAFLAWLKDILSATAAMPETALPMVDANDEKLQAAFEQSPEVKEAVAALHAPEGTQAIGIGGIATLITLLPQLLELFRALQKGSVGKVG